MSPELFFSETQWCFELLVGISDCLQSESAFHTWPWFCWGKNERLVIFALLRIHFLDHSENSSLSLVPVFSTILWIRMMNYTEEYSFCILLYACGASLSYLTDWCVPALHLVISLWIPHCQTLDPFIFSVLWSFNSRNMLLLIVSNSLALPFLHH